MTCARSESVIAQVRDETGPKTILSFSRGKDAIAAWLAIRDHFEEVVPYHLYLVPGLEFVDESLAYYERVIGRKIYNLPHPSLYRWLNSYLFQNSPHAAVIDAARLNNFAYPDVIRSICEEEDLGDLVMAASGVRAADSPMRRVALNTHCAISRTKRQYYPVWDWDKGRLIHAIDRAGVALPIDYQWFGRSFDGLDARFLVPMKKHCPADYRRVLEWFPLAEMEVYRYERATA